MWFWKRESNPKSPPKAKATLTVDFRKVYDYCSLARIAMCGNVACVVLRSENSLYSPKHSLHRGQILAVPDNPGLRAPEWDGSTPTAYIDLSDLNRYYHQHVRFIVEGALVLHVFIGADWTTYRYGQTKTDDTELVPARLLPSIAQQLADFAPPNPGTALIFVPGKQPHRRLIAVTQEPSQTSGLAENGQGNDPF